MTCLDCGNEATLNELDLDNRCEDCANEIELDEKESE